MKVIADGGADFVSFGKLFLANPDLPLRFARSAPLNVPDRGSFYGGDDQGYIDYRVRSRNSVSCFKARRRRGTIAPSGGESVA